MKISRLMPLILFLAFLKFVVAGTYFFLFHQGKFSLAVAEAKAEAKTQNGNEDIFSCPKALYEALRIEKERLAQEKESLAQEKARLSLLEKQIQRRLAALENLNEEVEQKLNELKVIKTKRFKLLVGAYGNMKPSKAAKLLVAMEPEMAIKILSALKTEQVARILSAMPPEKAASLAEALSGLPPREM
ncbi:MgtE intracellular region [Thermodesulfatator indicus DSM 15286]|uniref:MgtE intracellular region n=1 Tax=Thermodesulfatator indicus (strain DSM 15286 / JCM 11887 / CIR29812) TaxID=667014 RepID=F8ABY0_THEID|nr:MgtE intracellular region [Thermodesulfatator indicus]AEH45672.1 MgtE intracellular region [Thermodesulfatator indicus DSM 15286]